MLYNVQSGLISRSGPSCIARVVAGSDLFCWLKKEGSVFKYSGKNKAKFLAFRNQPFLNPTGRPCILFPEKRYVEIDTHKQLPWAKFAMHFYNVKSIFEDACILSIYCVSVFIEFRLAIYFWISPQGTYLSTFCFGLGSFVWCTKIANSSHFYLFNE